MMNSKIQWTGFITLILTFPVLAQDPVEKFEELQREVKRCGTAPAQNEFCDPKRTSTSFTGEEGKKIMGVLGLREGQSLHLKNDLLSIWSANKFTCHLSLSSAPGGAETVERTVNGKSETYVRMDLTGEEAEGFYKRMRTPEKLMTTERKSVAIRVTQVEVGAGEKIQTKEFKTSEIDPKLMLVCQHRKPSDKYTCSVWLKVK